VDILAALFYPEGEHQCHRGIYLRGHLDCRSCICCRLCIQIVLEWRWEV